MSTGETDNVAKREHLVSVLAKGMTEPKIAVIGLGGAGNNIVSRVHSGCKSNVHTVAINTDEASLQKVSAHTKLLIGKDVTQGKGTNGFPEVGEYCAECAKDAIREVVKGKDIVFVVTALGGGTGTGTAPVVAKIYKENHSFTFIIAINPFSFEKGRQHTAEEGLKKLKAIEGNTVVVDNDMLLKVAPDQPLNKAFGIIDRNVMKIIDSFCAQVNQAFINSLNQEVSQYFQESQVPAAVPARAQESMETMVMTSK